MNLSFIKPDKRKIAVFVLLFFLLPFPVFMYADPFGTGWSYSPLTGPLMFFACILRIVLFELEFYSGEDVFYFFLYLFICPLVSYTLSCALLWTYSKIISNTRGGGVA